MRLLSSSPDISLLRGGDGELEEEQLVQNQEEIQDEKERRGDIIPPNIIINNDPKKIEFQEDIYRDEEKYGNAADVVGGSNKDKNSPGSGPAEQYVFDGQHQMFHNYYKGKSGKVVEEMLMAHAYIFHQNATYGGCCGTQSLKMEVHEDFLEALGLKGVLRFKCPRDFQNSEMRVRRSVIPKDRYMAEDTRIWTPDYVDYLRSLVKYPKQKRQKRYTIAVQILRGNSSPCKEKSKGYHSYLPNLHYQTLIDKYMKPDARVIIFSSEKSFEDLNGFRNRGYEVHTDTSLKETWKEYVTADVFIMSRSDFSLVPAMVAQGTVVYTPFWNHALRRWKRVSKAIMAQTDEETIRLQKTKCVFRIG